MEDNWSEIDTSQKKEEKVEYEVEKEPEKVEAKPEPVQEKKETPKEEKPEELDGIKTKGGILLPDAVKDYMSYLTTVGRVIKVGDLAYQDIDKFPNGAWCEVNDYICYGKHAGQKLFYKGVKLLLLFDDQVIMKVEDPTHLDPTFNLTKM